MTLVTQWSGEPESTVASLPGGAPDPAFLTLTCLPKLGCFQGLFLQFKKNKTKTILGCHHSNKALCIPLALPLRGEGKQSQ